MSYCRFQNTLKDLRDCDDHFDDILGKDEHESRMDIFDICKKIVDCFEREDLEDLIEKE